MQPTCNDEWIECTIVLSEYYNLTDIVFLLEIAMKYYCSIDYIVISSGCLFIIFIHIFVQNTQLQGLIC